MVTAIVILLLLASLGCNFVQARAARSHTAALSAFHGDLAASVRDVRRLIAKIDGGTTPK
jgi:hypothetical protein